MTTYRCPVCRKPLSREEYEAALGILSEREKHLQHEKAELQRKLRQSQQREKQAREEGIRAERSRTQRLLKGKDKQIQTLKERIDQLKKGSTPQFKNPIEEVIQLTSELKDMIKDGAIEHFKMWQKRWDYYQTIHWDSSQINKNLQLVLHGKEPKPIGHPKVPPLQLPASTR